MEESGEGLAEHEFIIGTKDNALAKMYLASPGISEKRLWLKSIREAQKTLAKMEQENLKRQRSSKFSRFLLQKVYILFTYYTQKDGEFNLE